jgi:tRNA pseudouridine38-40 synthase
MTHGVLLTLAYDGTEFSGWAAQSGRRTVEETLAGAIRTLDPRASAPRGSSRTDAGVHAKGQLAAFDASLAIPPRGWVLALNQHLPDDACVRSARVVPARFHPRFASRSKLYRYTILLDRIRDPALRSRAWRVGWPIDLAKLEREARAICGTHDFAAFRSSHDERQRTVRTIHRVAIESRARSARAGESRARSARADESPARSAGADESPARSAGADESPARSAGADEPPARSAGANDRLPARSADVHRDGSERGLIIAIEGDGFLHNMVRILVGTLMDVARGKLDEGTIARTLAEPSRAGRAQLGMTAPAHGLSLESIDVELPEGAGEPWPP